jgi:hypothetical protein
MAAESTMLKNNVHGSMQLLDGTGTPVTLSLSYDKGNLKCGPLAQVLNELVKMERRGRRAGVGAAFGNRIWPTLSWSSLFGNVVGASAVAPGTPWEFLTKKGAYSANVSTLGANAQVYTVDIKLTIEGTNYGDTSDETITFEDVYVTSELGEDVSGNELAFTAEVLGSIVANSTNTITYAQVA